MNESKPSKDFWQRVLEVARKCNCIGWGYGGHINWSVAALDEKLPPAN